MGDKKISFACIDANTFLRFIKRIYGTPWLEKNIFYAKV